MKCILIGNGEYHNDLIMKNKDDLLIVVDGGYNHLKNKNITIDLIVGDLDSINDLPNDIETIKYPEIKDYTDMDLAIREGIKRGYSEFIIYGALGKRLEHSITNIYLLQKYKDYNIKLIDQNLECFVLENKTYNFKNKGLISIFSLTDKSIVSIKGLKYNLENKELTNSFPLGIDNQALGLDASIKVTEGVVLVMTRFIS